MNYNEWLSSYTKITGKLNKKSKLTDKEIYDLNCLIDKLQDVIDEWAYQLEMKSRQK